MVNFFLAHRVRSSITGPLMGDVFQALASDGMKESPEKPWLESLKVVLQSSHRFLRLVHRTAIVALSGFFKPQLSPESVLVPFSFFFHLFPVFVP